MLSKELFFEKIRKYEGRVCFGVGKRFEEFKEIFCEKDIADKIMFCVDSNSKLHGTKTCFLNKELDIYPVEYLKKIDSKNILILITCNRFLPIEEMLKSDVDLENIQTYAFTPLYGSILEEEAMKKELPQNIKLSDQQLIPKVIHYFWFGNQPLPEKNKKCIESWHKYCPDYEIKLWNEYNYNITKIDYMREAYEEKKWGFVPDYARLDVVYQFGGIYLDTDVELIKNIDDLLYEKAFICFESRKVNLGSGFGAQKKMPMIKAMRDDYQNRHFINKDGSLNLASSNTIQAQFLRKMGLEINGEYQIFQDVTIFPEKTLCGKHDITRRICLKPYTRAIHHFDGSWLDNEIQLQTLYMEKKNSSNE